MSRFCAIVLAAALVLTPAVAGACAALICAPGGLHQPEAAVTSAVAGHHGQHAAADTHAGHMAVSAPAATDATSQVRGTSGPDCCTMVGAHDAGVAVAVARTIAVHAPAAMMVATGSAGASAPDRHWLAPFRSPPKPPGPVSAPLVLRI